MFLQSSPSAYRLTDFDNLLTDGNERYVLRIKDLNDEDKPREKLQKLGPSHLTVAELLAIIIEVGNIKEDVLSMSQRILKEYGEKSIINETNPQQLSEIANIPITKASRLIASFELGRRFYSLQSGRAVFIRNPKQAYSYLKEMGLLKKEQLRALYLNSRYQIIRDEVISVGSLTSNIIHPREIFQPAIEYGAVAIIIAHNHPSGSLRPSLADKEVTKQLRYAGQLLGIDLLDHLIITTNSYKTIKEET